MTERLSASEAGLEAASALLRSGALVAFPTDTVYGIGCRVGDPDALDRIFAAKRRPIDRLVPILAASLEEATGLGYLADDRSRALARHCWPGALTIVLPAAAGSRSAPAQAFRVPDHPVALDLIRRSGPLAATSANRSDEPETYDADDVLVAFADTDLLAAVVDGGRVSGGVASTVIDLSGERPRLVREGPVTRQRLAELIGPVD